MSSFPEHEKNVERIKKLGLPVTGVNENPYETWNYDILVEWVGELIDVIDGQSKER